MLARFFLRPAPIAWFLLAALVCASPRAGERFVSVPIASLKFEGDAPVIPSATGDAMGWLGRGQSARPYVVLDAKGEAYLHLGDAGNDSMSWSQEVAGISFRTEDAVHLRGRLFVPHADTLTISEHRFEVSGPSFGVDAQTRFYEDMAAHYAHLLGTNSPGAAWFRHRRDTARRMLGQNGEPTPRWGTQRDPADTLDLFTGARAVAENLDIDRNLRVASVEEATVDIGSIQGVTTRAYDWKPLVAGKEIDLDPLAKLVPADQHAVFFPTFDAMTRVFDEVDAQGTPLLEFFDARVEDFGAKERYQAQMLLPLTALGRALGPTVISTIAVTGSDPFLVGGTDIVMLFDCKQPALLEGLLAARRADAERRGAAHVEATIGAVRYVGSVSFDRRVSTYSARLDSTIVVTNSLAALKRIVEVAQDPARSLATADEYKWFRDRYKRGDAKESALLVLTDATIRRWAGPRSRIGDARRLRAAAAMAEIQARNLDKIVTGALEPGTKAADADFPISADFVWTKEGVRSPTWGSLSFQTPISELDVARVSPAEKQAYEAFRSSFQSRWRTYFDPIAVRVELDGGRFRADATIRPLVLDTDYKEIEELSRGSEMPPSAGDPHANALFHFAVGFNRTSEIGRMFTSEFGSIASRFGADPLSWLGPSIALYGDHDPWWGKMRDAQRDKEPDDVNWWEIPVALHVSVKDPLKLAVFLTALRTLADESAPNLTRWEGRTWNETGYVRIAASDDIGLTEPGREAAIYYVSLSDALVVSPREDLIKNTIDRHKARKAGQPIPGSDRAWLGRSAALRLDHEAIDLLAGTLFEAPRDRAEQAAWSALPILDEWKRRYPGEDPVALHERVWGVRIVSPAGGSFAWNAKLQAMESTDFGRPGAPKKSESGSHVLHGIRHAELGLTFEDQGLRAVVELEKKP